MEIENYLLFGKRGEEFKIFIKNLLLRASLPKDVADYLLEKKSVIQIYENVFTHKSHNSEENYEFYELIGDVTSNKIIVWYLREKFPFLCTCDGVKVLARLRINLVSKATFSRWSSELNFLEYISFDYETKLKQESSVLEDVFEAFVGATEYVIEKYIRGYSGYYFCFKFLQSILDNEEIKLSYKSLYDPITRLKETCDFYNSTIQKASCPYIHGSISFSHEKLDTCLYLVRLHQNSNEKKEVLLQEKGKSIIETKYLLCQRYIDFLEEKGFKKQELKYYEEIEMKRMALENE